VLNCTESISSHAKEKTRPSKLVHQLGVFLDVLVQYHPLSVSLSHVPPPLAVGTTLCRHLPRRHRLAEPSLEPPILATRHRHSCCYVEPSPAPNLCLATVCHVLWTATDACLSGVLVTRCHSLDLVHHLTTQLLHTVTNRTSTQGR